MKLKKILIPLLIIALLVIAVLFLFNKGTTEYFRGFRTVSIGKQKHTFGTALLPFHFFEEDYDAGYVKDDSLFFISTVSGQRCTFPEELAVFNFVYEPEDSSMYYTVCKDDSLILKRADFLENTVRTTGIAMLHRHRDEFTDPISQSRGLILTSYDTVFLECLYSRESEQFESFLACIPKMEISLLTMDDLINDRAIELLELQQNEDDKFMKNIMVIKMKTFSDLNMMMNEKPVTRVNYRVESGVKIPIDSLIKAIQEPVMLNKDSVDYFSSWRR